MDSIIFVVLNLFLKFLLRVVTATPHFCNEGETQKLKSTLSRIRALLKDAEDAQIRKESFHLWLGELKDAASDAMDFVEEVEGQVSERVGKMQRKLTYIRMGPQIKEIRKRLEEIESRSNHLYLKMIFKSEKLIPGKRHPTSSIIDESIVFLIPGKRHPTSSIINESIVFGRETDREKVVGLSTSDGDSSAANSGIQVGPICGMGGLGKTTLSQLANNDEHVVEHFEEKPRAAVLVSKSAPHEFIQGLTLSSEYTVPDEVEAAGFQICADELGSIVGGHDVKKLKVHGGVQGVANKLATSTTNGITTTDDGLKRRQEIHGINKFTETPVRSFWVFVWKALQDLPLIILAACAFISLIVGIATEGWPKGAHDGLGIVAGILVVVFVTATSNYRQSLQLTVQVTRNGYRQNISMYGLLPGDIVHLAIGDQVPTDGLFLSGFSVLINESSLTGESKPVTVNEENPFLLSGTKVQDGSCKMLVTTVGMRTQWGKLMASRVEGGDDKTPLQVQLNGVATIITKIGLFFAVVTFVVLVQGLFRRKLEEGTHWYWSGDDALEMLQYFAVAATVVVVAVPEGLPLAVTLSRAFATKKMMTDRALVRRLSACETMGSATIICSDKTGTLTTNHMTVVKAIICGNIMEVNKSEDSFCSGISDVVAKTLMQSIFNNTGGEIVINKDGKREILGTPTEAALLEFGLLLGGDFQAERQESKIVKVEPFNTEKKWMGVVLQLPEGEFRAHCKGASDIVLAACDNVIDSTGQVIPLDEAAMNHLKETIECFASDSLSTLCLAYMEIGTDFSPKNAIPVRGYTCIGIVGIKDPVRPGVRESIAICRSAGITVRMVTGDNINTAKAVARELGILTDEGLAIEGPEFREKNLEEMNELIPKIQVMARSSPLDKKTLVKHLRTMFNEVVAVTGDGTNDAPALHEADIGLAMGIAGTEVAKESADIIILDDNFSTIVAAARSGRCVYINIQKFVQFQLTVIVVALIVNFSSACLTGNALLPAVQLLWVTMIMGKLGALALATEPPQDDLMKREPVRTRGSLISSVMWRNVLGQSLFQFVVIWYLQTRGKWSFQLAGPDADRILNTLIFNTFFFCQVFNEISSREMEKINVFKGMVNNYVFVGVLTCTVAFQVVIIEFLGDFANTTPLTSAQWFLSIFIGFLGMPIAALIKLIPVVCKRDYRVRSNSLDFSACNLSKESWNMIVAQTNSLKQQKWPQLINFAIGSCLHSCEIFLALSDRIVSMGRIVHL